MTFCKLHVLVCFIFTYKRTIGLGGINLQSVEKMTIYQYTRTTKCFQFCHLSAELSDLHRKGFGDWGILDLVFLSRKIRVMTRLTLLFVTYPEMVIIAFSYFSLQWQDLTSDKNNFFLIK